MKKRSIITLIVLCVTMFALAIFTACTPKAPTVEAINFKDGTVKSTYTLNEEIDYSSIKLEVLYSDDSTKELSLTETGVEYTPIDTTSEGQKKLSATYENKHATKNVEVIKSLSSIEFVQNSLDKTYVQGSTIDYANIIIKINYNDGSHETKNLNKTDFSYTEIDTSVLGKHTFEVTFNNKKINIEIEIKAVVSIEILNLKEGFGQGETINYNEIYIKFNYHDLSYEVKDLNTTDFNYNIIDTDILGTQNFVVSLKDNAQISATKVLTIQEATVQSIEYFDGLKAEYQVNGTFNDSEVRIKVIKDNTDIEYVYLNDSEVNYNADLTKQGDNNLLSITYGGRFCTTTIKVVAVLEKIEFQSKSLSFEFKDDFIKSEIKLNVIYNDPAVNKVISLADEGVTITQPISLTDKNLIGATQTLKVAYLGKTDEIEVKVNKVLVDLKFKADTRTSYYLNNDIDYSKIIVVASFNNDTTEEINLNDSRIKFTQIDITKVGSHKLQVEFMGKLSDEITIEIKDLLSPAQFTIPESYQDYKAKSSSTGPYKINSDVDNNPYLVGSINKFSFVPLTTYYDADLHKIVVIDNPYTVFNLSVKENGEYKLVEDPSTYVVAEDNMYKFSSSANDKFFKLEVMLDGTRYNLSKWIDNELELPKALIEFKVVDAYNVYDTLGLSVIDNLNVKNWAEIKEKTTLKYDDKKLSEYTDVKLVVLHNDISINPDHLPANYFWKEDVTPNYKSAKATVNSIDSALQTKFSRRLNGSLRDYSFVNSNTWLRHGYKNPNANELSELVYDIDGDGIKENFNEDWECVNHMKGLFNTNQTNISGNYMTISAKSESQTRHLTSVFGTDYDTVKTIMHGESVSFFPFSHWSIFKFYKTSANTDELNISVRNLTMQGNMSNDYTTNVECGLTAINSVIDTLTVDNVITTQFYTHVSTDNNLGHEGAPEAKLNVQLKNSIMFDAFSNMFTMWRSNVEVINSELTNAAGPLFVLSDGNREANDQESDGPSLTYDDASILEAYATGQEAWYMANNATTLLTYVTGDFATVTSTITGLTNSNSPIYKSYLHNVNNVNNVNEVVKQVNMIAVIIPEVGSIFNPESGSNISIKGTITIKGDSYNETYNMVNTFIDKNVDSQFGVVGFTSGSEHCAFNIHTKKTTFSSEDPTSFATKSTNTMFITLSAKMLGVAQNAPFFGCLIGGFDICQK